MAIKMRRGNYANLDTTRLVGGEIAVTDSPEKVIVKTNGGEILELVDQASVDTALSTKVNTSSVGANNGVASLDNTGKVPSSQLPSYVDDVIEGYLYEGSFYEDAQHTELITPESSKIYVDLSTDKTYRWSGTVYVDVTGASAWGEIGGDIRNQSDLADALGGAEVIAKETVGWTNKNLLSIRREGSITSNGITMSFVNNADGELERLTLYGLATADVHYQLDVDTDIMFPGFRLAQGDYYINDSRVIELLDPTKVYLTLEGFGQAVVINGDTYFNAPWNLSGLHMYLNVKSGYNPGGANLYPMIRKAAYFDPTFEPYSEETVQDKLDKKLGSITVENEIMTFS